MLRVLSAGPHVSIQDLGRPGWVAQGLSRGGAADPLALSEGAALLGNTPEAAAIEMAGLGALFEALAPMIITLTGAEMTATCEGTLLSAYVTHRVEAGQTLSIAAARRGVYGYLHVAGGIEVPRVMGARSAHRLAAIAADPLAGQDLPIGQAQALAGLTLQPTPRLAGGVLRVLEGPQTGMFDAATRARFEGTLFHRTPRANRQGTEMGYDGPPFEAASQLNILSQPIVPGDVQMTGNGAPFVLLVECQTTGGYPRMGTVVPQDLPLAAQADGAAPIRFQFVDRETALRSYLPHEAQVKALATQVAPVVRDPASLDLAQFQLISGATLGFEGDST